jgi:type IV pili sensor histidine kinase/response regulator
MKMKRLIFLLSILFLGAAVHASNVTQVERYMTVDNKPKVAQINPLLTVVQVHFPRDVETVGDAVNYWISYSGYRLVSDEKASVELKEVLKQRLPQSDRNLGPLTIKDGLKVLVGQDVFDLVCDPLHRLVSFELKKKYKLALHQSKRGRA